MPPMEKSLFSQASFLEIKYLLNMKTKKLLSIWLFNTALAAELQLFGNIQIKKPSNIVQDINKIAFYGFSTIFLSKYKINNIYLVTIHFQTYYMYNVPWYFFR